MNLLLLFQSFLQKYFHIRDRTSPTNNYYSSALQIEYLDQEIIENGQIIESQNFLHHDESTGKTYSEILEKSIDYLEGEENIECLGPVDSASSNQAPNQVSEFVDQLYNIE